MSDLDKCKELAKLAQGIIDESRVLDSTAVVCPAKCFGKLADFLRDNPHWLPPNFVAGDILMTVHPNANPLDRIRVVVETDGTLDAISSDGIASDALGLLGRDELYRRATYEDIVNNVSQMQDFIKLLAKKSQ